MKKKKRERDMDNKVRSTRNTDERHRGGNGWCRPRPLPEDMTGVGGTERHPACVMGMEETSRKE